MNRVWMITGAGRGLGRAFAEEAVKNGDKVIATIRKINDTDSLMNNENVLPVIMDVTAGYVHTLEKTSKIKENRHSKPLKYAILYAKFFENP